MGVAPRPPYSLGQCRQAQPACAFFFCQALAAAIGSTPLSSSEPNPADSRSDFSSCGALPSIQARTSARNAASAGVSSKFIGWLPRGVQGQFNHEDTKDTKSIDHALQSRFE